MNMPRVKMIRKFNGKLYFWYNINKTKQRAKKTKSHLKAKGKRARIIKHKHGYDVYTSERRGSGFSKKVGKAFRGKDF